MSHRLVLVIATLATALGLLLPVSALADPRYEVMNAPEGVYWRSEPNWAAAERISGFGVYNGTIIEVHCYQSGTTVEGSADTMWEQATDVGGRGYGSGWVNEHFINDGQPINQPSPGVPPCGASPPAPPASSPAPPTPPSPSPTPSPEATPSPSVQPTPNPSSAPAANHCPAFAHWEDWLGGVRVHGYVSFRPSDTCNGRHVKRAYIHIIRKCGPYRDFGRWYTQTATSQSDKRLFKVSGWVFDSLVSHCNTNVYYGYSYF
jgi:hypothetical protein